MKKILVRFLLLLCFLQGYANAQSKSIEGRVSSATSGANLSGVSVVVLGSGKGTQTDGEGRYVIEASAGSTLLFTYVGYIFQRQNVNNISRLDVKLQPEDSALEEVVVTGYGTTVKLKEFGGASVRVSGKDFENQAIASFEKALQGRAAGVVVQANNGIPGGAINVQIRGVGSFTAGTEPLYIVDGVQLSGGTFSGFTQGNSLAGLNTNDIESIEILKDAATASIYGSQAANGVVLITTKRGKAGRTQFNVNAYTGRASAIKKFDVLNTQDYIRLRTEAYTNAGIANPLQRVLQEIGKPTDLSEAEIAALPTYDWQNETFREGTIQNYELSARGGNDKTTFYLSGAYNDQQAILTVADFKRGTFNVKVDHKASERLSFGTALNLSSFKQKGPYATSGSFFGNPSWAASLILPSNPIYNEDGTFFGAPALGQAFPGLASHNVVLTDAYNVANQTTNNLIGSVQATYKITPELSFKSFYSLDYRLATGKHFNSPLTNDAFARKGYGEVFTDWKTNFLTNQTLNYDKTFSSDHSVSGLLGFEYKSYTTNQTYAFGDGYPSPLLENLGAAANPLSVDETWSGYKLLGGFARGQYSYKGKYVISGTLRYSGSSRFGAENQFGWFPGATLAWNIADENFLKDTEWINLLKFRASAGSVGNDRIGDFASRALFSSSGIYAGQSGIAPSNLANPNLKWEKITTYDLGIDYGFFNNRLTGSAGVYLKRSTDLLLSQPLLSTSGYSSITTNVGALDNKGVELEISSVNVDKAGFQWNTSFNFTYNKNEITQLYGGLTELPTDPAFRVGWDLGAIYSYRYAGVNPATGRNFYYDTNGDVTYAPTADDRYYIGSSLPKYTGGLSNTLSYKGLSLDFLLQYQYGRYQLDGQESFLSENGRRAFNTLQDIYDRRWTTPGQITDVPRAYNGGIEPQGVAATSASSYLYKKTDYIRLKHVELSYSLPKSLVDRAKFQSIRFYVQGTNLWTLSDWTGYDPEFFSASTGIIPQSKNITFGVQLGL
ncbi:SusC/RagA family TonB-linked outer membrane protein [Sphingobacterium bambusae]|uniref:TonB-dependent receptor n=1 Tax=Sphingobacterium bambusae TaxID=662858 RepID=A0ABW6B9Z6_9SPHI|nr:TonB-dependent receptor [Sphingobacterium bambusae]WPL49131.1 TonB-dependent receptor [Sphingobacterium bambusae]